MTFHWLREPDDLTPVYTVRQRVFVEEQGFRDEFDDLDHTCWHLLCEENGNPMACARIFPEEGDCWHIGVTSESYLDQHCPHRDMERPVAASEI